LDWVLSHRSELGKQFGSLMRIATTYNVRMRVDEKLMAFLELESVIGRATERTRKEPL
jgi:hypothetical protein